MSNTLGNLKYADRMLNMDPSAIREILKLVADSDTISFAGGLPSPESFPTKEMAEIANDVILNDGMTALQYCTTDGHPGLRQKILDRMEGHLNIKNLGLENIALLNGSQQGLDLMGKIFLNEGDVVFVEEPTYLAAINAFTTYQPNIVGIKTDANGIIIEDLKKKLEEYPNAKFIYLIPDFQNPSGRTMSAERRQALIDAIEGYPLLVLEDNPYGELRYSGELIPPVKAFDRHHQVVYLSTFSKVLSPGIRLGWVIGGEEVVQQLMVAKQSTDLQSGTLSQHLANAYMEKYDLDEHINGIKQIYGHRRDVMLKALDDYMPAEVTWTKPDGGLFLWMTFPENVNASDLLQTCVKNKVAYVPGEPFFANDKQKNTCRLNFSFVPDEIIIKGIKAIAKSFEEYTPANK